MGQTFFSPDFLTFFKELGVNNNKEWFHSQKNRYQSKVREPMKSFVAHMKSILGEWDPALHDLAVSKAIFRINNDIRFKKDVPLYKMHMGAILTEGGRKNLSHPGYYIQVGPDKPFLAGGIYMPDKNTLYAIRSHILSHSNQFITLFRNDTSFQSVWGGLGASKENKRLPKEFSIALPQLPELRMKQFYWMQEYDPERIISPGFDQFVKDQFTFAEKQREFLLAALQ